LTGGALAFVDGEDAFDAQVAISYKASIHPVPKPTNDEILVPMTLRIFYLKMKMSMLDIPVTQDLESKME
jgi:hypothetical protein